MGSDGNTVVLGKDVAMNFKARHWDVNEQRSQDFGFGLRNLMILW